jgi:integrase
MGKRRARGEGGIYQRKDGRWEGQADLGWVDGKRIRKSVYGGTEAEVIRKLRKVQERVDAGLPVGDDRMTVAQLLDVWLLTLVGERSSATIANYEWAVRVHLVPGLGRKRISALTPMDVTTFLRRKADAGYERASRIKMRTALHMALHLAEVQGWVGRNVASLASNTPGEAAAGRSLTPEEARLVLRLAEGNPLEIGFWLALMLGMRPGEVLGLPWSNVELDDGIVRIRQALKREYVVADDGRRKQVLVLGPVKTRKSRRSLAAPPVLMDALRRHREAQAQDEASAGDAWQDKGLVVMTHTGTWVDPANFRRSFSRVTTKAGLGHWKPNELRHSFVSLLHDQGVPMDNIADATGHETTRMTAGVYRHLVDPVIRHAANPMTDLFGTP